MGAIEWLVGTLLDTLKSAILEPALQSFLSAREDLEQLSRAFTTIQAVLHDAERKQGKEKALSIWLDRIKEVAYDLSDLLDECKAEALRAKIQRPRHAASPSSFFLVAASSLSVLPQMMKRRKLGAGIDFNFGAGKSGRISDIKRKLDDICNERNNFHLNEYENRDSEMDAGRTSSLVDESRVFGRETDKNRVVKMLVSDTTEERPIISIVGMDGLGKTTLAQLVYNDPEVAQHFETRMWVHVSRTFDARRICNAIAEAATRRPVPQFREWEMVQNHLRDVLCDKRFLLILDDLWNEDNEEWEKARLPLFARTRDSRIIITTCKNEVVKAMGAQSHIHRLNYLPEEDCWSLFKNHAFSGWGGEERLEFEYIGKEIVKKCGGMPLLVRRLAAALRLMRTAEEWTSVLNSETWNLPDVERGIEFDFLAFYYDLPSDLKRCFEFCSLFPKDHVLEKDTMIQLWMSQGFIPKDRQKGEELFLTLLRRSMFEVLTTDQTGRMTHCKMKDIVHDMIHKFHTVVGEYHIINVNREMQINKDVPVSARHATLIYREDVESIPSVLQEVRNLRTLITVGWSRIAEVSADLFQILGHLKVLDMSGSNVKRLPDSLGNLTLLTFLNLSATEVEELPESVSGLILLQTLKLNECRRLRKLPKEMRNLVSLRHLEIKGTSSLGYLPKGIGKLTSLVTLSKFIVAAADSEEGASIEELGSLDHLEGELDVVNLERLQGRNSGLNARMKLKESTSSLGLYCNDRSDDEWLQIGEEEKERVRETYDSLEPHMNLMELRICNYSGIELPSWISRPILDNLIHLRLADCRCCQNLPDLGRDLRSLKYLEMDGMNSIWSIKMLHPFPNLENLIFKRMRHLQSWDFSCRDTSGMPRLIQLTFSECPSLLRVPRMEQFQALESLCVEGCTKLSGLPYMVSLQHLRIVRCPRLTWTYGEGGRNWFKIAHVRNKQIDEASNILILP